MSKRSFEEFATAESCTSRYQSVLDHANRLLEAAESLKQDLERLGKDCRQPSHETILSTLKRHNAKIHPVTQALSHAETASVDETCMSVEEMPQKTRKREEGVQHSLDSGSRPGLPVPRPVVLTKWTPDDFSNTDALPALPPVLNPVLERAARTHSGIAGGLGEESYERLEWIGDAYLYLISSAFIYQTFPNLPTGRSSQLRERLIKNETLSEFTVRYGIDKRARLPTEFQPGGRQAAGGTSASKKERKKLLGDLFEAYTAAAILGDDDGLSRVTAWVKTLWSDVLKREISDEHKTTASQKRHDGFTKVEGRDNSSPAQPIMEQSMPAKAKLAQAIGARNVTISYRDEGPPKKDKNTGLPWYTVAAYYDGLGEKNLLLGYGSGLSKKDAGAIAATKALENKKLIKRLQKLKDDMNQVLKNT